jgi:hypothetical protein
LLTRWATFHQRISLLSVLPRPFARQAISALTVQRSEPARRSETDYPKNHRQSAQTQPDDCFDLACARPLTSHRDSYDSQDNSRQSGQQRNETEYADEGQGISRADATGCNQDGYQEDERCSNACE